jgi:hypothetical protein
MTLLESSFVLIPAIKIALAVALASGKESLILFQKSPFSVQVPQRVRQMTYQLNFLSNEPEPITAVKKRRSSTSRVIKPCTTEQAAILLDVSTSTLYRARRVGSAYKSTKNDWIAIPTGRNSWKVVI